MIFSFTFESKFKWGSTSKRWRRKLLSMSPLYMYSSVQGHASSFLALASNWAIENQYLYRQKNWKIISLVAINMYYIQHK